jgi:hypothetical protein
MILKASMAELGTLASARPAFFQQARKEDFEENGGGLEEGRCRSLCFGARKYGIGFLEQPDSFFTS